MQTQDYPLAEPQSPVVAEPKPARRRWSLGTRIVFRFAVIYFGLRIFPFPLEAQFISFGHSLFSWYHKLWTMVVPWVGSHFMHLPYPVVMTRTGSGDTEFSWVWQVCFLTIAAVATVIWSVLDRKRAAYPSLHKWFRVWVRIYLASVMFGYGAAKAFPVQMPGVFLSRLVEPFGNFSPMGVLWTFMGASKGYEITTGCVEILAGVLLLVPRTALLGALVEIMAMGQVFLLNMFYDVPVKIYSFEYMLMGVFILAPDATRLIKIFFLDRATERSSVPALFRRIWPNRAAVAVQVLLGLLFLGFSLAGARGNYYTYGVGAPNPPLYGVWSVKEFSVDGTVRPPLLTDSSRWHNVLFERFLSRVEIQTMDNKLEYFKTKLNLAGHSLELDKSRGMGKSKGPQEKAKFSIQQPASGTLILDGMDDGHRIHAVLERVDESKFLLLSRGFHWVSEQSFNK